MPTTSPAYMFTAPGALSYGADYANRMIRFGQELRDRHVWNYPIMGGALKTTVEIAATREFRISGSETGVVRMFDSINNSVCMGHDGIVEYGFEPFLKRCYTDSLVIGRMMFTWEDRLRYLDPAWMTFDLQKRDWYEHYTQERFPVEKMVVYHPIPFGSDGMFVSPISFVVPTAMLAWLVQEHDKAAADGRKIRDMYIVRGKELADSMTESAQSILAVWAGANAASNGVNIVSFEPSESGDGPASDMVYRIGLANIPEGFDRESFTLQYVNEIASALGIAMRHFYNGQENGTNRSLEEVQEARQLVKGPAAWVRMFQRYINQCGYTKQFGRVRMGFVEEVDAQTQKSRAEILKLYADAFGVFNENLQGTVLVESLVAWLQSENILPPDLEIIQAGQKSDKVLRGSDDPITPNKKKGTTIQDSDPTPSTLEKDAPLGYDEITLDQNGRVVERRLRVFSIEKIMELKIREEMEAGKTKDEHTPTQFTSLLVEARAKNLAKFLERKEWADEDEETVNSIKSKRVPDFSDEDYRTIQILVSK